MSGYPWNPQIVQVLSMESVAYNYLKKYPGRRNVWNMETGRQIQWDLGVSGLRPLASGMGHRLTVSTHNTEFSHRARLLSIGLGSAEGPQGRARRVVGIISVFQDSNVKEGRSISWKTIISDPGTSRCLPRLYHPNGTKDFWKQMLRRRSDENIYEKFLVILPPTENGTINGRGIKNISGRDKVLWCVDEWLLHF